MSNSAKLPETATLRLARLYASLGWSVVPVVPGHKLPDVEWARYQTVPATDAQLADWYSSGGYGIGLVQGAKAGTVVLDFDGEEGQATRADLERAHGPLPKTIEALTPGGGCHVILQHPGRPVPTRKYVRPGMDVRGDGGFIVAHPSVHPNGRRYEWDCDLYPGDVEAAACPDWVADIICGEIDPRAELGVVHEIRPGVLGMSESVVTDGREVYMRDTVLAVLREMVSETGKPTVDELFDRAWPQYSRKVDFSRPGRGADEFRRKCAYTLRRFSAGLLPGIDKPAAAAPSVEPAKPETPKRKRILSLAELKCLPPPVWLVDGLVPEKGLVVPFGPPKKGKTFIILSLGLHIAAGLDWMGRKVEQGGVVYIAGEGIGGLGLRVAAMQSHYGISDNVPFWVIPSAINFADKAAVADLIKLVRDTVLDEPIALVVVDTLARAMPGVDENSSQEVGVVIAACDLIKTEMDCTVMPIHHAGKDADKGLRGSSAIHGAVDASFLINGTGKSVTLKPVDQKEADPGPTMVFEMVEVMVGIGRSSLVPVLAGQQQGEIGSPASGQNQRLSTNESLALRALIDALAAHGRMGATSSIPGNVAACTDSEWREAFRNLKAGEDWNTARQAFRRVSTQLIEKKIVGCSVPYVWNVNGQGDMR